MMVMVMVMIMMMMIMCIALRASDTNWRLQRYGSLILKNHMKKKTYVHSGYNICDYDNPSECVSFCSYRRQIKRYPPLCCIVKATCGNFFILILHLASACLFTISRNFCKLALCEISANHRHGSSAVSDCWLLFRDSQAARTSKGLHWKV